MTFCIAGPEEGRSGTTEGSDGKREYPALHLGPMAAASDLGGKTSRVISEAPGRPRNLPLC